MDEPRTWKQVGDELASRPRGAVAQLARELRMDASYLRRKLEGRGEPTVSEARVIEAYLKGETRESSGIFPPEAGLRVPVFGYAAADAPDRIAFGRPTDVLEWMELARGMSPTGDVVLVRQLGSAMEPRIFEGEYVIVQRRVPPMRDRDALIEFNDGTAVLTTYKGQRDGRVYGEDFNPRSQVSFDASTVRAIHKAFCRL